MKRILGVVLVWSACCFAGDLTTLDGTTYRNVKVTRVEADGLVITHAEGAGKLQFLNLPEDVRKKYSYDPAKAEAARKAAAGVAKGGGGWQEMDQRMIFLTVQLSSVEASLTALNRALVSLGIQQVTRQSSATIAQQANEAMDRNAGGPVPWADFYGRTAEKFFYHPTDKRSSYHTLTILRQQSPAWDTAPSQGVPSRQGLPVHQRPPQFDYIYRANAEAEKRAQAEVARLGNNANAILERRRQLEAEQAALWCKIAFHAVAGSELLSKPLYYYDLKSAEADTAEGRQRLEAMRAAMEYLRNGNKLAAMVEQGVDADAARCYGQLQAGVGVARSELERRLMAQPALVGDISDSRTMLGKFVAVAKRMGEVSANITDAHRLALDGDRAGDQGRKLTFRSQLQQSLMLCAEALLAGDECVNELAREWKVGPAMQTTAPASETVQASLAVPMPKPVEMPTVVTPATVIPAGANTGAAAITISCSEAVRVEPLEVGRPTAYDQPEHKLQLHRLQYVSPELAGWQFLYSPLRKVISYEVSVNQDGFLYALGSGKKSRNSLNSEEACKWEDATGQISGSAANLCIRRKVVAGEIIKLQAIDLRLAARSIELVRDGKAASDTQTAVPTAPPVVSTPPSEMPAAVPASAANTSGAAITISCSGAVRVLPLEAGKPTFHDSQKSPPEIIHSVSRELSGWQYVSPPMHDIGWYEVRVNQNGLLYAFGCRNKGRFLDSDEKPGEWESAAGAIQAQNLKVSYRRKVVAGETIKVKAFHLLLAAKSIRLDASAGNKEAKPDTQPPTPSPTPADSSPQSSAQPGQPWTNSLGMKFVQVPGTAVQFSIWDTRVQDYQAFVTATGRSCEKPPFEQGPTHPVVMIRWEDAKAFCSWLTEKERRAGVLTSTQEYRLPTDLEWSAAVGLENEPGSTPEERDGKIRDVYPWGTQWPPPPGAGNYDPKFKVDDFANTSPVGSFAANRFGLYDMGGNAKQWCEDFYNGRSGNRVLRGSGWGNVQRNACMSSVRDCPDSNKHRVAYSFRCVLAGGGVSAPR